MKAYCSYTAKVQAVLASNIVPGVIHSDNVMKIVRGTYMVMSSLLCICQADFYRK